MSIFLLILPLASAGVPSPAPFPVFLKIGFSSILEFEEPPTRVVLGDSQSFQVERLDHSLVVKTVANEASTNMFVYFKELNPRLFILTASDDAEPTYFKRFETLVIPKVPLVATQEASRPNTPIVRGVRLVRKLFDTKKDYLVISIEISADSKSSINPEWNKITLQFDGKSISPLKIWAERKEIQKDSQVKARLIIAKPNLPRDLKGVSVSVPLQGESPMQLALSGNAR